jgi:DNA-binding beta-propeller fold protein YncE
VGGASGSAPGEMDAPGGVAEAGGRLFAADFYNHRVDRFGPGAAGSLGRAGRVLSGRLHYPTDVSAAGDSLIYVADAYNHRIQVFRPDGTFVRKWGGPLGMGGLGSLRGWFKVATGVEVSRDTVYVADFENHRVQVFTPRGHYLGQVADSLFRPTDMVKGGRGELYVVDFGHDRIVRFERR